MRGWETLVGMNRAQLDKDPADVAKMFDTVAARYDLMNDVLSLGQTRRWRTLVADAVDAQPGERVLDLAAGTGTSSVPFAQAGAEVIAGDISEGMLAEGRKRNPGITYVYADALDLPFEAVGLLIAVDWFAGIFRTFLNVNGDTFVAMLVANASGEIDRGVYNGKKQVTAEGLDVDDIEDDDESVLT